MPSDPPPTPPRAPAPDPGSMTVREWALRELYPIPAPGAPLAERVRAAVRVGVGDVVAELIAAKVAALEDAHRRRGEELAAIETVADTINQDRIDAEEHLAAVAALVGGTDVVERVRAVVAERDDFRRQLGTAQWYQIDGDDEAFDDPEQYANDTDKAVGDVFTANGGRHTGPAWFRVVADPDPDSGWVKVEHVTKDAALAPAQPPPAPGAAQEVKSAESQAWKLARECAPVPPGTPLPEVRIRAVRGDSGEQS